MSAFLASFALAFGVVLLVELPDKTLVATIILATRFRPRPVLFGVAVAFAVQCLVAVFAGQLLHLLPKRAVEAAVAVLFGVGAVLLLRESAASQSEEARLIQAEERAALPFWRIAVTAFGVVFAAEWGDASQIATAGLVARQGQPLAVGLGAWVALVGVAALGVWAGQLILRRVPVHVIHQVAGVLFAAFAILAAIAAIRG